MQNVQDRVAASVESLLWKRSGNTERWTRLAGVRLDTVWSSTRMIYAGDTRKNTMAASTTSPSAVTTQGAEALEEETATMDELLVRCKVTGGGIAVASTIESGTEIAIEDGSPRKTATRYVNMTIPNAIYLC